MKRIPSGLLLVTFFFATPLAPRLHAVESAGELADQTLGPDRDAPDKSAEDLAKQQGVAIKPGADNEESAEDLARQTGVADQPGADPEQSAENLAKQRGVAIKPGTGNEESARKLAEQEGLEKPSKKAASPSTPASGDGVIGSIYAVVAQPDGSAIIGGRFTSVDGQPRGNLARLRPNGTLDAKFLPAARDGVEGAVYALALDAQGNLLVGGFFTSVQGQPRQNFARYLATGALDPAFAGGQSPNGPVYAVTVQADGRILIGGQFSQVGDAPRRNLARFRADGALDAPILAASGGDGSVRALAALPKGLILAGGTFEIPNRSAKNILITGQP